MPARTVRVSNNNERDGHIYYVINGEKGHIHVGIVFLNNYPDLQDYLGSEGLYLVRNAAGVYEINSEGEEVEVVAGDPTVHEGWAIYCWDNNMNGPHKGGWRKVAEQESVDGPWGIDERILKMLVKKTEFNVVVNDLTRRVVNVENNVQTIQQTLVNIGSDITSLKKDQHRHGNKEVLDEFEDKGGQLAYKGRIISGNTFLYDNVVDGKLYWVDPTFIATEEDPEFIPVECATSADLVKYFVKTSLASHGLIFEVLEANGEISRYDIVKTTDGDGNDILIGVFKDAVTPNTIGVNYVMTLPEANHRYDGRGIWCPLIEDGVYTPRTFYISRYGEWVEFDSLYGKGVKLNYVGAKFGLTFVRSDPDTPFKKVYLSWTEPASPWQDPATLVNYAWGKTTLVRKFGSVPTSINDGTIVTTNDKPGIVVYEDTCPYSNEQVYYQLFSETKGGAICNCYSSEGSGPKCLTWTSILQNVTGLVKVGDEIVLPEHPVYGKIMCEVIGLPGDNQIVVATKDVLAVMKRSEVDAWITKNFNNYTKYLRSSDHIAYGHYGVTSDTSRVAGKKYFLEIDGEYIICTDADFTPAGGFVSGTTYFDIQYDKDYVMFTDEGYKPITFNPGEAIPEGVTLFEPNTENPNGIIRSVEAPSYLTIGANNISTEKHFNHQSVPTDWWNVDTIDDGTDKGTVVVFTLGL